MTMYQCPSMIMSQCCSVPEYDYVPVSCRWPCPVSCLWPCPSVLSMTMSCLWPCSSVLAMFISQCCSVLSMIMSQCHSVQCKTLSQYPHIQVNILFNEHWDNSNMQEAPTFTRYKITFSIIIVNCIIIFSSSDVMLGPLF
jgi:hypothetical protein